MYKNWISSQMQETANAKYQHLKSSARFVPFKMGNKKTKKVLLRNDMNYRSNFYTVQNQVHIFFFIIMHSSDVQYSGTVR